MLAGLDLFILEDLERLLLLLILPRRSEQRPARKLFRLEELRLLLVDLIEGDFVKLGRISILPVETSLQLADAMTKPLLQNTAGHSLANQSPAMIKLRPASRA